MAWTKAWVFAFVLVCTALALATTQPGRQPPWSGKAVDAYALLDESGKWGLDDVRARFDQGLGTRFDGQANQPLGGSRTLWMQVNLPTAEPPMAAILAMPRPSLDSAVAYLPAEDGRWTTLRAGDSIAVADWPKSHLYPAFPVVLGYRPAKVYLAIRNDVPIYMPVFLTERAQFDEANQDRHMAYAAYIGLVALMVVVSSINSMAWRDGLHLLYAGYVTCLAFAQVSASGLGGEYFWPHHPWWNDLAAVVTGCIATALGTLFVIRLTAERGSKLSARLLALNMGIAVALCIAFLALGRAPVFGIYSAYVIFNLVHLLVALFWYAMRNARVGWWIFAGFLSLTVGIMAILLPNVGIVPFSPAANYAAAVGSALELPLVFTGLYLRSRRVRDNRLRLLQASRVDPLTGIASHAILMERLTLMLRRPTRGALLRVQVANAAAIDDAHGTEILQLALVRAGGCVAADASESDTASRYRNGGFVLLLNGVVSAAEAAAVAQRIVVRGLKPTRGLPDGLTLTLHVAYMVAPFDVADAQKLLGQLDLAIGTLAGSRGTVIRLVGPSPTPLSWHKPKP